MECRLKSGRSSCGATAAIRRQAAGSSKVCGGEGVVGGEYVTQQLCMWLVPDEIWGMMVGWGGIEAPRLLAAVSVSEILNSEGRIDLESGGAGA